ncbi:hypothetical protein, partial [Ruegeria sp. SCP11]|uniref:hypothetical protein n=1 Tax=Ruegeria sp. SCP11 TaxID=3141378 RepID=UPI00333DAFCF
DLTVTDPDDGDSHTFSVDDARFEVVAGQLKLKAGEALDHETEDTVNVEVTAEDTGSLTYSETFVITVNDLNEAPTDLDISNSDAPENIPGATVGVLSADDVDFMDTLTYSILPGDDGAKFTIVGDELRVGSVGLDFEATPTLTVNVRVSDSAGLFVDRTFTINVLNSVETALTPGTDIIGPDPANIQIIGNAQTLNASDDLDAGTGDDSLVLFGGGPFDLNSPVKVDGFEEIQVVNLANSNTTLTLRDGASHDRVILNTIGYTLTNLTGASYVAAFDGGDGFDNVNLRGSSRIEDLSLGSGYGRVRLYDSASIGIVDLGNGGGRVSLRGTGSADSVQGGSSADRLYVYSTSAWSGVTSFDGGGGSNDRLRFFQSSATF